MYHIVITGGAGYIGSVVAHVLFSAGYRITLIDHAPQSHVPAILRNRITYLSCDFVAPLAIEWFTSHRVNAVIHLAASIEVGASVTNPSEYYCNNVFKTMQLMELIRNTHVPLIIAASSSAVYGTVLAENREDTAPRLREESNCTPCSPYGRTKLAMEWILKDYEAAYGIRYGLLRFCNVAGALPDLSLGERHLPETHLIPRFIDAHIHAQPVHIYGTDYPTLDGSCVRDFVHVYDVALLHEKLLIYLLTGGASTICTVGSGHGSSVLEVLQAVQQVTSQTDMPLHIHERRSGDPAYIVADISHARTLLEWEPRHSTLDYIVRTAFQFRVRCT